MTRGGPVTSRAQCLRRRGLAAMNVGPHSSARRHAARSRQPGSDRSERERGGGGGSALGCADRGDPSVGGAGRRRAALLCAPAPARPARQGRVLLVCCCAVLCDRSITARARRQCRTSRACAAARRAGMHTWPPPSARADSDTPACNSPRAHGATWRNGLETDSKCTLLSRSVLAENGARSGRPGVLGRMTSNDSRL